MRKFIQPSLFLLAFFSAIIGISGCNKVCPDHPMEEVCDVRGTYSGTFINQSGYSGVNTYNLKDNNFADGSAGLHDPLVTYGSYTNTCDSLFISSFYTLNGDYYYFKGAFSASKDTVTGTYQNVSMPDEVGTFTFIKQ